MKPGNTERDHPTRCPQAVRAPEYGLGELSPAEAAAYERHAAACPACARAVADVRRVADAIRQPTGLTAAPDLADRVLARLADESSALHPLPRSSPPPAGGEASRPLRGRGNTPPQGAGDSRSSVFRSSVFRPRPARVPRAPLAWAAAALLLLGFGGLWLARVRAPAPAAPAVSVARRARADSAAWLRQTQRPDGGWSAGQDTFDVGVSGIALLALTASLRDAPNGPDRAAIHRGVTYLLSRQDSGGLLGPAFAAGTYNHGLGTLALLEACAVESNAVWRAAAARAVDCAARLQDRSGGWSYLNQGREDVNTSASVWPLLALVRADSLGFSGLRPGIGRGLAWLKTTIGAGGLMGYHRADESPHGPATLTAAGALCLLKTGDGDADPVLRAMMVSVRESAAQIGRLGEPVDFYRAFFVAQALALAGDDASRDAQSTVSERLLAMQARGGAEGGSWPGRDAWTAAGGPVYATALAALAVGGGN